MQSQFQNYRNRNHNRQVQKKGDIENKLLSDLLEALDQNNTKDLEFIKSSSEPQLHKKYIPNSLPGSVSLVVRKR